MKPSLDSGNNEACRTGVGADRETGVASAVSLAGSLGVD
jgi:hypothetical protein